MTRRIAQLRRAWVRRREGRWSLSAVVLLTVIVGSWTGCSPERRYRVMNFFFDGVPDPNAPEATEGAPRPGTRTVAIVSRHKPFVEDQCLRCHQTVSTNIQLNRDDSSMCLQCHADRIDQYPVMHGAVAGKACLWCHNPHQSALEVLLRELPPALCMQCHGSEIQRTGPNGALAVAGHADLDRNCLDCHWGHGGTEPGLLRVRREPTDPAPSSFGAQPHGDL